MDLDVAIRGLLQIRKEMRSQKGVKDPMVISESMQRLAQYTGAVEEELANLEEELEHTEMGKFLSYKNQGMSVNMSETLAKQEVGELKGQIAKLTRLVNSSWKIISTAQSRYNHLKTEYQQGGNST